VDVDLDTFNMDPSLLEAAVTPRTKAVIAVHQLGMPCDLQAILAVTRRHGIPLVEDAACAIGSEIRIDDQWERVGRPRGDVACFSFHPRKLLSTGDGGMLTTHDPELDRKFRLGRHHGMSVSDAVRHASSEVVFETYPTVGYNYRMTDIQAAVGREQLKRLPTVISRRRELASHYHERLQPLSGVTVPREPEWARTNWQSYAVRLADGLEQRRVMQRLLDAGIATRRGVMNAHREAAYPPGTWRSVGALPRSERAQDTAVLLPLYHQMTDADQDLVVRVLEVAIRDSYR
jgi:dTDP-4-amino-4,6-dideoxygalactose transaminase